jgi:hypothetical protein
MGHRSEFYSRPMNLRGTHSIGRAAFRRIGTTFRAFGTLCAAVGAAAALAGCEDTGEADGDQPSGNISLRDENNYTSSSDLMLDTLETSASDLEICWEGLTSDLQCHELDPATDINNVSLLRFRNTTQAQVTQRLVAGNLALGEINAYREFNTTPQSTCTKLSSFGFLGTSIDLEQDYVAEEQYTYLFVFANGTTPGVGSRAMQFVKPTATSANTRVDAPLGCGLLSFTANLSSTAAVNVPAAPPWVFDWSQVTRDGQNNPIDFPRIDSALLGFYPGMTVAEIEEQIFDIEQLASPLFDIEFTSGRMTADLSSARERGSGAPFTGFERDREGLWLFALRCSECQNPQPVVLSVLEPAP